MELWEEMGYSCHFGKRFKPSSGPMFPSYNP